MSYRSNGPGVTIKSYFSICIGLIEMIHLLTNYDGFSTINTMYMLRRFMFTLSFSKSVKNLKISIQQITYFSWLYLLKKIQNFHFEE